MLHTILWLPSSLMLHPGRVHIEYVVCVYANMHASLSLSPRVYICIPLCESIYTYIHTHKGVSVYMYASAQCRNLHAPYARSAY